ncbi:GNAT family N-acetyltransferase [Gluconacetobacter azotocaptans]|uniref:GNAT family N-acetyltransferase n=1 Tax=Gluconacetobacter azotocaptans TaxID=142834 RepID=A0A7W4JVF2_9PROT|nr:GNAT family N-acetyltransferase [Gluconacetobacter azotocaptans]MBB2191646.1 GNAT family N-acetyltransferase [Gluconacetobacter azotocaptans]GBQ34006.1 N-acetyltransferase GCN5 [Gluconacetobacter azotocaptans DSM 13594]
MIETERLRLSLHQATDFDDLREMWGDPNVVRYISGVPSSEQESWFRLLRYRGLWDLLGYGYWCVRSKADGRYVGDVGFADLKRLIEPPLGAVPEAGWVLASWAHGRGFATEALRAALAWMDGRGVDRTVCIMASENDTSRRVAEKCGYSLKGNVSFRDRPTLLLQRERKR